MNKMQFRINSSLLNYHGYFIVLLTLQMTFFKKKKLLVRLSNGVLY